MTPLHKKRRKRAYNYRPISLKGIACKVMQPIIKYEILLFMINNNLLRNLQHLLVPGKFCKSNLLSILNTLTDATEYNLEVDFVYLDFAMAFDSVTHS